MRSETLDKILRMVKAHEKDMARCDDLLVEERDGLCADAFARVVEILEDDGYLPRKGGG